MIVGKGEPLIFKNEAVLLKKCVARGDYQQRKGVRSQQVIPTGKMWGFRKFDKVRYEDGEYFIKGRIISGYAILMDIKGNKQEFDHVPKFSEMMRVSARTSQMITECSIHLAPEQ